MSVGSGIRTAVTIASLLIALGLAASHSAARDSNAPDGASDRWLPCESWAMYHWNPVDRRTLMRQLRVDQRQLRDWLRIDGVRSLADLAGRQGVDPDALRAELMAPWERKLSGGALARVRANVDAMLSQGHLAAHMLFHTFHHAGLALASEDIFGISLQRYLSMRNRDITNRQLARRLGIGPATAARRMRRVMRRYAHAGRRRGQLIGAEERWINRRAHNRSRWWLDHKLEDTNGVARATARAMRRTRGRAARACLIFAGPKDAGHQRGFGRH